MPKYSTTNQKTTTSMDIILWFLSLILTNNYALSGSKNLSQGMQRPEDIRTTTICVILLCFY